MSSGGSPFISYLPMKSHTEPIHVWVAIVSAAAAGVILAAEWSLPPDAQAFWDCFAALLLLGVVSEASFLKLRLGTVTGSVAFIPYLAAIPLLGPSWGLAIAGLSEFVAETLIRRKPAIKVLHNTCKKVVAVGLAGMAYVWLGGAVSTDLFQLHVAGFAAAVAVFFVVDAGGTSVAVSLSSDVPLRSAWRRVIGGSLLFDFLSSPLALLLAFLYVEVQLIGIVVVTVPLFLIRHVYSVNLQLEQVNRDLLELMVKAIEARDPYTSGHSLRVSRIAGAMARGMDLPSRLIDEIETAALLHDVGKIYEEYASVLRKNGRLTKEEAALMRTHAIRSYELVRTISGFRNGVDLIVRHHHENFDGSGYPDGIAGQDIPLGARIIMVADTADAMTTDRPYRQALGLREVIDELKRFSGKQFDPDVVEAFVNNSTVRSLIETAKVDSLAKPMSDERGVVTLAVR